MNRSEYRPLVFRYALFTVYVALLAVVVGALVTTKNAGMAFRDWPTSDGHNMFLYPWLQSAGDEFLEHGHRLAGSLIGLVSIGLVVVLWCKEPRVWVRKLGLGVLLAVIFQGILGGTRVLWDAKTLALVHSTFGASVLSLMAAVALVTSRSWVEEQDVPTHGVLPTSGFFLRIVSTALPLAILLQYFLGGMLRHLGRHLFAHLGGAFIVLVLVVTNSMLARKYGSTRLKRTSLVVLLLLLTQVSLGFGAFITKFGFPPTGYVAIQYSIDQVVFRTVHTVVGMLLLMMSVVSCLSVRQVTSGLSPNWLPSTGLGSAVAVKGAAK